MWQPRERLTPIAAGLAVGIAIAPVADFWTWWAVAAVWLLSAALLRRCPGVSLALLVAAVAAFGGAWAALRGAYVPPTDVAARMGDARVLVHLRGIVLDPPALRTPVAGSMAAFAARPPATYFALRVTGLRPRNGAWTLARGTVLVRVAETLPPMRPGETVQVQGMLLPPRPAANPGALDARRLARARGRAGLVAVPRRALVQPGPPRSGPIAASTATLRRWRALARRHASAGLLSDLPPAPTTRRDALLSALLLGQRGPDLDGLDQQFRHVGLAHVMAISGLHLGVLAGLVLGAARLTSMPPRAHGWLVIAVVVTYLLLVEVRLPVLRAGVMTVGACLGLAAGRRLQVSGILAASAVVLLVWRPAELLSPGFQLSYGVVLGLVHLAPRVRARLFGPPDLLAPTTPHMLGQWLRTAVAAALTAWAVATPIAMHHWGVFWPWAAPFSVLVVPVVGLVLTLGYAKMLLACVLPSAALLLGVPLSFITQVLVALVEALDAVPGASVRVGHASAAWSLLALLWIAALIVTAERGWGFWCTRPGRGLLVLVGAALLVWAAWPHGRNAALRLDMLAVGDGTCMLVRSSDSTVVYDAGSSDLDAGRRVIVPALQRLGVRAIDAIVVSHANLDHYSAVLELVGAFTVREVLITPHLLCAARAAPRGPVRYLLDELGAHGVPVTAVAAGAQRRWGSARWRWVHPAPASSYARANDASAVIEVRAAGRSVLLCGDIQHQAMLEIGPRTADVLELPHHGSLGAGAGFAQATGASVALQSTGPARWRRTCRAWAAALPAADHLITARDGMGTVEIELDGRIHVQRYRPVQQGLP